MSCRGWPSKPPSRGSPPWLPSGSNGDTPSRRGRRLEHVPILVRRFQTLCFLCPLWPVSSRKRPPTPARRRVASGSRVRPAPSPVIRTGTRCRAGAALGTCPYSCPTVSNSVKTPARRWQKTPGLEFSIAGQDLIRFRRDPQRSSVRQGFWRHDFQGGWQMAGGILPVSYTHLRAHETVLELVCRLLLEKKNKQYQS